MTKDEAYQILTRDEQAKKLPEQFEQAYRVVFHTDLHERLKELVAEYGLTTMFIWELGTYGWDSPAELLGALSA